MLAVKELLLAWAQLIVGIDLVLVSRVAFEDHEFLVVEDEVGAFVEGGKNGESFGEFEGIPAGLRVAFGSGFAELDEAENFFRKCITDTGDGSGGTTVNEAVVDLGIDAGHQDERIVLARDVFGGVAERVGSTKFLEPDERREFLAKGEEKIGFGFETVVGRVVNDGGEFTSGFENFAEVMDLRCGRASTAQNAGNDHETIGTHFAGVGGVGRGDGGVLRAGAYHGGDASLDESLDSFHALLIGEEGPVAHGATINNSTHALCDEVFGGFDERVVVDGAVGIAGGHQGGNAAFKNGTIVGHEWSMTGKWCFVLSRSREFGGDFDKRRGIGNLRSMSERKGALPEGARYIHQVPATPLVPVSLNGGVEIWCKLEFMNPSGSTKDRIARHILEKGWRSGKLKEGSTVVEASSGSTSIAFALACSQMNLHFVAFIPDSATSERECIIKAYGGEVRRVPGTMVEVLSSAAEFAEEEGFFLGRQFANEDNTEAHRIFTGPEILRQIPGGCVDAVVSGVGTGGTLRGLFEAFQLAGCGVTANAAIPRQGELFGSNLECCSLKFSSDVPGVAEDISEIYSGWECDQLREWEIGDASCLELTRKLWAKGFPVGPSSGLNFAAAVQVAAGLGDDCRVVTVFPDRMERYFSHKVFDGYRA